MKALVSTVTHLLLVDITKAKVFTIESHRREYYGISWFENHPSLVLSHSGINNNSLIDLSTYANSETGYLSFGDTCSTRFLSQPHQIFCAPNGWVIASNTGRNCITLYNPENGFYKDIRVNDVRWDRLSKNENVGEHFNSVFIKNDKLYVAAHAFNKGSYLLEFSFPHCELLNKYPLRHKSGIHNIWVDAEDNLIVCDSHSGSLFEVKSNQLYWSHENSQFTRGLAVTKDIILVGDSEVSLRQNREKSQGDIWVIDRHSMKTLDCIPLGEIGGINDIRVVDVPDEAHHQHLFSNLGWLESIAMPLVPKNIEYQSRRTQKLQVNPRLAEHVNMLTQFDFQYDHLTVNADGWFAPRLQGFLLAIAKQQPGNNVETSLDYQFSGAKSGQHISLVMGYQGHGDSNMIAFLLEYSRCFVNLSLWENKNDQWIYKERLGRWLKKQGKISVRRNGREVIINITGRHRPIVRQFDEKLLAGRVGVRTEGVSFRNFNILKIPTFP